MSLAYNLAEGSAVLNADQFQRLRDFLYDISGLYFTDAKKFLLENRLQKRMRVLRIAGTAEYLDLVLSEGCGGGEVRELLDVVTTHETSFFRNGSQLEAFRRHVLPEVLKHRRERGMRTLRIWSAACSSGEEPYTLAMLILELMGAEVSRWRVKILGTDIAHSVLEKARNGVYSRYSFRTTPAYFAKKYFTMEDRESFRVTDEPRRLVEFQHLNFADDAKMRMQRGFDIVFCRNALIYFDAEAKRRFVEHFYHALNPEGYLFIGHSESLHGVSDAFKLIHFPGALAYFKPAECEIGDKVWKPTV